jgi:hypothetical protein
LQRMCSGFLPRSSAKYDSGHAEGSGQRFGLGKPDASRPEIVACRAASRQEIEGHS